MSKKTLYELIDSGASIDEIKAAIASGADVNCNGFAGATPLHVAAKATLYSKEDVDKYETIIRVLIEAGADVNASDGGATPLFYVQTEEEVKLMLAAGADVNYKGYRGDTPLHYIVERDAFSDTDNSVVCALIAGGADVNARNEDGETPLHKAVGDVDIDEVGLEDVIRALIDGGADVNAEDNNGRTPLWIVKYIGLSHNYDDFQETIQVLIDLLLQAGANDCEVDREDDDDDWDSDDDSEEGTEDEEE